MSLKLNSSGGGSVTLQEPVTASTLTLTLPAFSGTAATLASVTNNGVLFVNSSGQPTSGSALTFDGSFLGVAGYLTLTRSGKSLYINPNFSGSNTYADIQTDTGMSLAFSPSGSEQMRLTSTGLGIGTSSPSQKLTIQGSANVAGRGSTFAFMTPDWRMYNSTSGNAFVWDNYTTEAMRLDSSGNLLVGITSTTPSPTYGGVYIVGDRNTGATNYYAQMFVAHNSATNHGIVIKELASSGIAAGFLNSSGSAVGSITTTSSSTSYVTSSDYRLKENIQPMTGALAKVAALKPVTYTWKADGSADEGFIAHELAEVCPSAVSGEKDAVNEDGSIKPQGIDTSFLVATLTAAIQEQQAMIAQLQADIASLKGTA